MGCDVRFRRRWWPCWAVVLPASLVFIGAFGLTSLWREYDKAKVARRVSGRRRKRLNPRTLSTHVWWSSREPGPPRVAVCVTGAQERLQPLSLVQSLLRPNWNEVEFHTFLVLRSSLLGRHSTDPSKGGAQSPWANLSSKQIQEAFQLSGLARVEVIQQKPRSRVEWQEAIGMEPGRIAQYIPFQLPAGDAVISPDGAHEMYKHQELCTGLITAQEAELGVPFDFIISTREDVYFFQPVQLAPLILHLLANDCDILAKVCPRGGLNRRWQLLGREAGMALLGGRHDFYRTLPSNQTGWSPGQFEESQLADLKLTRCPMDADALPVAATRINASPPLNRKPALDDLFEYPIPWCFPGHLVEDDCMPISHGSFVNARRCS